MWRPNPKHSKTVIFRSFTFDDEVTDDYGNPKAIPNDISKSVEVYPYSDVIKREAIGITNEEAYTIIVDKVTLNPHDVIVMGGMIYRINSISSYEPMQLVISSTGEKDE